MAQQSALTCIWLQAIATLVPPSLAELSEEVTIAASAVAAKDMGLFSQAVEDNHDAACRAPVGK